MAPKKAETPAAKRGSKSAEKGGGKSNKTNTAAADESSPIDEVGRAVNINLDATRHRDALDNAKKRRLSRRDTDE